MQSDCYQMHALPAGLGGGGGGGGEEGEGGVREGEEEECQHVAWP